MGGAGGKLQSVIFEILIHLYVFKKIFQFFNRTAIFWQTFIQDSGISLSACIISYFGVFTAPVLFLLSFLLSFNNNNHKTFLSSLNFCSPSSIHLRIHLLSLLKFQITLFLHLVLYLFSMIQDFNSHQHTSNIEKYNPCTPGTAESLVLDKYTPGLSQASSPTSSTPPHAPTLFAILENRFQERVSEPAEQKEMRDYRKAVFQVSEQECLFKIRLNIQKENGEKIKTFSKNIVKTIQSQNEVSLIFDRQHQKIKVQPNVGYIIKIIIQSLEGFERNIWDQKFNIHPNSKKWSTFQLLSQDKQKQINLEVEKLNMFFVKPLSIKLPICVIQQFFNLKLNLTNKSQILNTLTSISQLKGIMSILMKQNMGSRIIQKLLTKANEDQVQSVILELKSELKDMVVDRYGNFVFQKIFKISNKRQKQTILSKLQPNLFDLLRTKQGTHCIQSLLDEMQNEDIMKWFCSFTSEEIYELSTNKFSMHFIQKFLKIIQNNCLITQTLVLRFKQLANDRNGVVALKTLMSIAVNNFSLRYQILAAAQNSLNEISFSEFGHYIIEEMFSYYNCYELQNIINYVVSYSNYFAVNQYSSSIMRKLIENLGDYVSIPMIDSLLKQGLLETMQNSSGEFILHRLMQLTKKEDSKGKLMGEMMILSKQVKSYEKRQKWMKYFKLI